MAEGFFQDVRVDREEITVHRKVEEFSFLLSRVDNGNVQMEILVKRKDGKEKRIWFERLLPEWILEKVSVNLRTALEIIHHRSNEEMTEGFLCKVLDDLEDMFVLEIGVSNSKIFFTVRHKEQMVSVLDKTVSPETLEGFLKLKEITPELH